MRTTLSERKYKKLALESLRNSFRLLKDAITLYDLRSYPTAFQLAVLAIEEYAKAKWVDHNYEASVTNDGLPDAALEQSWLKLLYMHPLKQYAFMGREYFEFSPRILRDAESGKLEQKKQAATYVGLPKRGKYVDVNARISLPSSIKKSAAKQIISIIAKEIRDVYKLIEKNDQYFWIEPLNEVILSHEVMFVFSWPHRSGLKSKRFRPMHGMKK